MIQEIKARLEAATPGPWWWEDDILCANEPYVVVVKPWFDDDKYENTVHVFKHDAEFIANAPTDIRYLLDEVKRLTEENEQLTERLGAAVEDMTEIANSVGYIGQCKYCAKDRNECDVFDLPCDFEWRGEDKQNKNTTESEG